MMDSYRIDVFKDNLVKHLIILNLSSNSFDEGTCIIVLNLIWMTRRGSTLHRLGNILSINGT